jgi:hypothetical protein
VKLLRTIRLDPSDTFVFDSPAEPGEWAVSGAFLFWNRDCSALEGKGRTAFRSGLLGVASLGWSTLAQIVDVEPSDRRDVVNALASQLLKNFGAPDAAAAEAAAEEEVAFVESLCDHPVGTLVAVRRTFENGEFRESFRTLKPRGGPKPMRAFSFLEVEGQEEDSGESMDIVRLAKER